MNFENLFAILFTTLQYEKRTKLVYSRNHVK